MTLRRWFLPLAALLCLPFLLFGGCRGEQAPEAPRPPETVAPASHRELQDFFAARDYRWDSVANGVPPFILETLPADLDRISRSYEKKELFFLSLLPMALLANEEISSQRKLLEALAEDRRAGRAVDAEARQWVRQLAEEYRVDGDPLENPRLMELLLRRVDIIPPSLVLAQAATESGYGTSRFARTRNNLFGEFSLSEGDEGERRYRLRTFPSLYDSVQAYMKNLNTHPAYAAFRSRRAALRSQGQPLAGNELAQDLVAYSERGADYVRDIQKMIRQNRLSLLASVNLRSGDPGPATTGSSDLVSSSPPAPAPP